MISKSYGSVYASRRDKTDSVWLLCFHVSFLEVGSGWSGWMGTMQHEWALMSDRQDKGGRITIQPKHEPKAKAKAKAYGD